MREEFRATPKDTDAIMGEDVVLECSPPRGHPKPVVKWKKDGDNLDLTSAKRIKIDESGNLVIYKAQKKDQGRYQCTAENIASTRTSKPMRLKVHGKLFLHLHECLLLINGECIDHNLEAKLSLHIFIIF